MLASEKAKRIRRPSLLSPERERELAATVRANRDEFLRLALEVLSRYKDPRGEFEEARSLAKKVLEGEKIPVGIEDALKEVRRAVLERTGRVRPRPSRDVRKKLGRMDACLEIMRRAADEMVLRNQGLVFTLARRFQDGGLPFADLVQEGNIGLMRAVLRFDPGRGFRFSTFATWWIRQSLSRAVGDTADMIRLPAHVHERQSKVFGAYRRVSARLGREPSLEEVAGTAGMSVEEVRSLMEAAAVVVSLDAPVGEDGDETLGNFVPDAGSGSDPYRHVMESQRAAAIDQVLARLDERERLILKRRFGLDGHGVASLVELGEEMGLSRERVRQIQKRALEKVRTMDRRSGGRLRALM